MLYPKVILKKKKSKHDKKAHLNFNLKLRSALKILGNSEFLIMFIAKTFNF